MLPIIDAYLDRHAARYDVGGLDPRLKPKDLCETHIIEIRPDGQWWRVGMVARCAEFARRGHSLLEGELNGYLGEGVVMVLSGQRGNYQVQSLLVGPLAYNKPWADSHFSPGAAAWLLSANPPTAPNPIREAWQVFGFPAGTPAQSR